MVIFALLTTLFGIQSAMAGIVDTGTVISEQAAGERDRIFALIEREDARKRLTQYGVPADQAGERIAALTDAEVAELARRIDELPAGAASTVTILVVVIIVLLLIR